MTSTSSFAGEILRLKSGNIRISDLSKKMLFGSAIRTPQRYFVIQFKNSINEETKSRLALQGIETKGYLPDDALLVKSSAEGAALVGISSDDVQAVVPYQPDWKVSSEFFSSSNTSDDSAESVAISAIDSGETLGIARELNSIPGVEVQYVGAQDIVAKMPRSVVSEVAKIDGIEWIQPMPLFITFTLPMSSDLAAAAPSAPVYTGYESGTKIMNFDAAWSRGYTGEGQMLGMADTGLDTGEMRTLHPDFGSLVKGYAFGLGSTVWEDPQGHGTHVAGSIVGSGKASDGNIKGGASGAKFVASSLWSPIVDNLSFNPDFNVLLGTPYKDGVRIHSNSWGSPQNLGAYDTFAARVDTYLWNNPDMLVLFAAGNSGEDTNRDGRIDEKSVSSPGTAKNVLTVGASENLLAEGGIQKNLGQLRDGDKKWGVEPLKSDTLSNNPDGLAAFSSRGPTNDGRLKPEIVAPGTNIVSTRSHHPKASPLWGEFNKDYVYAGGTSMATPLTAGAAGVARDYLVKARKIANPSGALVKATLIHTAKDLYPGQYGLGAKQELPTARPNVHEGYGRVDMDKATALGSETQVIDDRQGVGANEEKAINVNLAAAGNIRVTLSYTDAPASASAAKTLVNDLDIKVIGPNGKAFEKADRVNNTEMLELSNMPQGRYQVIVKGINVPQGKNGKQPYALLVSQSQ